MGIGVEAVVTDHDMAFVRNMRGYPGYELQIVHLLLVFTVLVILIANLPFRLIKGEALEGEKRAYHIFSYSFSLFIGFRSDLAVYFESGILPAENPLNQGKADELFPQKKGEDLAGEKLTDKRIVETFHRMEGAIFSFSALCEKNMEVRVKIQPGS